MLRITTRNALSGMTIRLEGRLAGPWVRVLEDCWEQTRAGHAGPGVRVDLTGVTSVDPAGEELLAALHRQGARLAADDCLTMALVAEITRGIPQSGSPGGEVIDPTVADERRTPQPNG